MLPKAATSSKPCGAAAMCCASRTRSKSAFRPDHEFSREPVGLSPPRLDPAANGGVFVCGFSGEVHGEIIAANLAVRRLVDVHQQAAVKYAVGAVGARIVREIELRGENALTRYRYLDMEMPCASGIRTRHDRLENISSLRVCGLISAQFIASVVIHSVRISV